MQRTTGLPQPIVPVWATAATHREPDSRAGDAVACRPTAANWRSRSPSRSVSSAVSGERPVDGHSVPFTDHAADRFLGPSRRRTIEDRGSERAVQPEQTATHRSNRPRSIAHDERMPFKPPTSELEAHRADERMMAPVGNGARPLGEDEDEDTKRPGYLKDRHPLLPTMPMAPAGGLLTEDWADER